MASHYGTMIFVARRWHGLPTGDVIAQNPDPGRKHGRRAAEDALVVYWGLGGSSGARGPPAGRHVRSLSPTRYDWSVSNVKCDE